MTYLSALLKHERIAFGEYIRNIMCMTPAIRRRAHHQAAMPVQRQLKGIPFSPVSVWLRFRSGSRREPEMLKQQLEFSAVHCEQ
jgi:hypothetical protein